VPRGWPEGLKAGPGPHDDEGEGHEAPDEEHHEHRAHRDRLGRGGRPPGEGGKDWKWGPWKGWWRWFRDCEFRWVWVWCIEGTCADPGGALSRGGRGGGGEGSIGVGREGVEGGPRLFVAKAAIGE